MRTKAKRDANESEIVAGLEKVGALVERINDKDKLDLIVGYCGNLYWLEVKDGSKPPSKRDPTEGQKRVLSKFKAYGASVVNSLDEALEAIGAINV